MAKLIVKNWREFQHYRDRRPAWIKLHHALLDDYEYQRLPVASRALAPMLWLLASESEDGSIEYDIEKLSFRLRQSKQEIESGVKPLVSSGFFILEQDDSNALAEVEQLAIPEKRREEKSRATQFPEGYQPNDSHKELAQSLGVNLRDQFPQFRDYCLREGKSYKDWDAGLRTWIRNSPKFAAKGTQPINQTPPPNAMDKFKANVERLKGAN